jgi:hypothetical protein
VTISNLTGRVRKAVARIRTLLPGHRALTGSEADALLDQQTLTACEQAVQTLARLVDVDQRFQQLHEAAVVHTAEQLLRDPPADTGEGTAERNDAGRPHAQPKRTLPTTLTKDRSSGTSRHKGTRGAAGEGAEPIIMARIAQALDCLEIRYLTDGDGSFLAMWERHAVLFTLEGPEQEILVMRTRAHATVPPNWAGRAYAVVNEWNHSRRFAKAYVGDPTERHQLPVYAEMQMPLISGIHDVLLVELIDCAVAVFVAFVDWLHDEGGLL